MQSGIQYWWHYYPFKTRPSIKSQTFTFFVNKRKFKNIDALAINFWLDHIHYFELTQVMHQTNDQIIEVLDKFWTTTHNPINKERSLLVLALKD